jgi:hypothetical protein
LDLCPEETDDAADSEEPVDLDDCVLAGCDVLCTLGLFSHAWVWLQLDTPDPDPMDRVTWQFPPRKLARLVLASLQPAKTVVVGLRAWSNLLRASGREAIDIPQTLGVRLSPASPPAVATQVSLSRIPRPFASQATSTPEPAVDTFLPQFFSQLPRVVAKGDILAIPTSSTSSSSSTTNADPFFVRVDEVAGASPTGALVHRPTSTLSLTYLPATAIAPQASVWLPTWPPPLQPSPLATRLLPLVTTGLVSGRHVLVCGSGAASLTPQAVHEVARWAGCTCVAVNSLLLCGDTAARTETRLAEMLLQARKAPGRVLLLLEHAHALFPAPAAGGHDAGDSVAQQARVGARLRALLHGSDDGDLSCVPVVAVTDLALTQVPVDLARAFVHVEVVDAALDSRARVALLERLLHGVSCALDVDLPAVADHAAAMTANDLAAVVRSAQRHALLVPLSEYRDVCGQALCQADLEAGLESTRATLGVKGPQIPCTRWADVGGLESAKRDVLDTIQLPLRHPEWFTGGLRRSGVVSGWVGLGCACLRADMCLRPTAAVRPARHG